ncbi:MAG: TIGR00266 family protein [Clostridia bacterium]|nr:TIGR00266 family protein [Clostridia bacterium]
MEYKIIGQTVPVVEMKLNRGETVYTQSGGMAYQTEGLTMTTNARGGFMQSLGRAFTGESIFMANYIAEQDGVSIGFASTVPGSVMPININSLPNGLVFQKGAFLCAENTVETKVEFTKKISAGLFGGEGFILQKATGSGMLFLEIDGDVIEKVLKPGEVLKISSGNVVAFDSSVSYQIEVVKGLKNIFLGGEGLFLTKLVGPGRIVLQSQNFRDFANRLIPYIPMQSSN